MVPFFRGWQSYHRVALLPRTWVEKMTVLYLIRMLRIALLQIVRKNGIQTSHGLHLELKCLDQIETPMTKTFWRIHEGRLDDLITMTLAKVKQMQLLKRSSHSLCWLIS